MAVGLVAAAPLGAQQMWRNTVYPYVYYSAVDGWWAAGHYGITSPIAAFERPELNAAALNLDVGGSTEGSYSVVADGRAPAYWPGWRLAVTLTAARDNRLGFYGVGNETAFLADSVTGTAPYFYRVSRTHTSARATLERQVAGPLRAVLGATIERSTFRELPGPSVFARDEAAGPPPFTDKAVRGGLVFDTRDNELDPRAGVLVEGLLASGTGYTRTTATAQLYAHPAERLVLAARIAGEGLGGDPPLASEYTMETGERETIALGGYRSLRGYYDARFLGPGKLLGGVEARYAVVWAPSVLELKLVGFYDAGRVFGTGEAWRLTTAGLHHGAGAELALRFLRNALVVAGFGAGADGATFLFATRWSY